MDVHSKLLRLFLFLLPCQTIWLIRVPLISESVWQFGVIGVYVTELILLAAFFLFLLRRWPLPLPTGWWRVLTITTLLFFLINIARASDPLLSALHLFRVGEVMMLCWMILGDNEPKKLFYYFISGLTLASCLGIAQFLVNATWASTVLGLSNHDKNVPGTTVILLNGIRHLRAYGPFPHPNIFGGFMAVGFVLNLFFSKQWALRKSIHIMCSILLLAGLLVSFSRSAWLVGIFGIIMYFFHTYKKKSALFFTVLLLAAVGVVGWSLRAYVGDRFAITSSIEKRSITERFDAYNNAWTLFIHNKWWGQGVDNYTVALHQTNPSLPGFSLQPVHNIPLLLLVEIGIIGIIFCVVWIGGFVYQRGRRLTYFLSTLFVVSPLLFFDHYLWTLYSGLMLFAIVISFFWILNFRFFKNFSA